MEKQQYPTTTAATPPAKGVVAFLGRMPVGLLGGAFLLLWCTGYPAARIALDHAAPFTIITLRFGIAALLYSVLAQAAGVWPRGGMRSEERRVGKECRSRWS